MPGKGEEIGMPKKVIMSVGAISLAAGLGCASFVFGCRIAGSTNTAGTSGVGAGLLLSIAASVWGIFALLLRESPGGDSRAPWQERSRNPKVHGKESP